MKICVAGSYAITNENKYLFNETSRILESFYYFKEWQKPLIKKAKFFLLDSGAFTFMANVKKGNIDWNVYIDRYIDFINDNDVQYYLELDIDVIVGYERVKEIRKYIEQKTKKKCIPVWHKARGLEDFIQTCKDYDYVAIGGIVSKEIKQKDYPIFSTLINIAHKNNCKIHGLGFTKMAVTQVILKVSYEIVILPLTKFVVKKSLAYEQV